MLRPVARAACIAESADFDRVSQSSPSSRRPGVISSTARSWRSAWSARRRVNKFIYGIKIPFLQTTLVPVTNPKRGDIVVFKFPEDPSKDFIKRVIGVAGDVIEIRNKKVYVNHKLLNHDHGIHTDSFIFPASAQPRDNFGPVVVPPHSLFVMGDNRDQSYDSRFWGFVDLKAVLGKALIIYWSWDNKHFGVRWNRIGHILH